MNVLRLSIAYLRWRPLAALLNVLLMALGIAALVVLLLFGHQLEQRIQRDAAGVDLVVGAPGSPLQLVLSSVFHVDIPTGNIPLEDAEAIADHRHVAETIPLALGDSYRGFRIVGTEETYPALYGAETAAGGLWTESMEAVLGRQAAQATGLTVGDAFVGTHGLNGAEDHVHDYAPYEVVGVLERTGTVLDRLILTSVQSVWDVHAEPDEHDHDADHHHDEEASGAAPDTPEEALEAGREAAEAADPQELTALLVRYASPLAALSLPREINAMGGLQAASPAYETARLMQLVGVGLDGVRTFAGVLLAAAGLALFIGLLNALRERRRDIAVLRALGAGPGTIFTLLIFEGVLMALIGASLGLLLGHGATEALSLWLADAHGLPFTGWIWLPGELGLLLAAGAIGGVAALIPAVSAYRTDVARILAAGLVLAPLALLAGCGGEQEPESQVRVYIAGSEELGHVESLGLDAGDAVDLAIIATQDGAPIAGERISVTSRLDNLITHPVPRTDDQGRATTRILAQNPGQDTIEASLTDGSGTEVALRVSDGAHEGHEEGEGTVRERDDVVPWSRLADLETFEEDDRLHPDFPEAVRELDRQTVRLQGFMMPLDSDTRQRRFMLTQSTPSCFYCVPGGPESAVEVKAAEPVDFTFEPMVLEGRFELMDANEMGLFYRLTEARRVEDDAG